MPLLKDVENVEKIVIWEGSSDDPVGGNNALNSNTLHSDVENNGTAPRIGAALDPNTASRDRNAAPQDPHSALYDLNTST